MTSRRYRQTGAAASVGGGAEFETGGGVVPALTLPAGYVTSPHYQTSAHHQPSPSAGGGGGASPSRFNHSGGSSVPAPASPATAPLHSKQYHISRASSPVFLPVNPYRTMPGAAAAAAGGMANGLPPPANATNAGAASGATSYRESCERCGAAHVCVPAKPHTKQSQSQSLLHNTSGGSGPNSGRSSLRSSAYPPPAPVPWRRILYERQPYPDNYTDETFLSGLVTNANVHEQHFGTIARDTASITQRVSVISIFFVTFHSVSHGLCPASVLVGLDVLLMVAGAGTLLYLESKASSPVLAAASAGGGAAGGAGGGGAGGGGGAVTLDSIESSLKRLMLFVSALLGLSPVLKTLTMSYSSDTIWACSIVFISVHLFVHDYTYINTGIPNRLQTTLSLNAGIFASVLLASRLPNTMHVFAFIFFAYLIFAGFPIVAHRVKRTSITAHLSATAILCALTVALLLLCTTKLLASLYTASVLFITFGSPRGLLFIQRYKNEIQGPWDYDDSPETANGE